MSISPYVPCSYDPVMLTAGTLLGASTSAAISLAVAGILSVAAINGKDGGFVRGAIPMLLTGVVLMSVVGGFAGYETTKLVHQIATGFLCE